MPSVLSTPAALRGTPDCSKWEQLPTNPPRMEFMQLLRLVFTCLAIMLKRPSEVATIAPLLEKLISALNGHFVKGSDLHFRMCVFLNTNYPSGDLFVQKTFSILKSHLDTSSDYSFGVVLHNQFGLRGTGSSNEFHTDLPHCQAFLGYLEEAVFPKHDVQTHQTQVYLSRKNLTEMLAKVGVSDTKPRSSAAIVAQNAVTILTPFVPVHVLLFPKITPNLCDGPVEIVRVLPDPVPAELVNASALGATSDAFAKIKAAFEDLEVDLAVSAAVQAGESLFRSDAQSSEPSLGSLAKSLKRLELTPLVSSFDIPVETDATLFASSKTLSFEDVPALPLPDGERRALSPLHSVEDRVPGAHPPLPRKFSPLGGDICVVGAQSSGNPSGNPSKVALSHVGVGGNPRTNQPSFPPQGDIEGHPVQVLASSGNPPGNSGGVDRPKSHSCSKLASDSSQVELPSILGFPGSKDGKPVRPPPLAPVVSSSKGTSIHGSPPVSYSPGNQSGSASTSKAPKELQGKPLPPMLQNWKFSPRITCRSPTSSAAVYSRPLGQDIGDSPGHSSSDPPGSVSYSAPPLSNSAQECCDPRVSAAFYSRPLGQDKGVTMRTPMLNDWGWVLFAAACLPATSSPISASPPLWVPMNLGTRSVRSA